MFADYRNIPFQHDMSAVHSVGDALLYLPHSQNMDPQQTAVCTACECYALAWLSDMCGTIPTMLAIEPRYAHDSLSTFAKYTLCWPCLLANSCFQKKPFVTDHEMMRMSTLPPEYEVGGMKYRCMPICCGVSIPYLCPINESTEDIDTS